MRSLLEKKIVGVSGTLYITFGVVGLILNILLVYLGHRIPNRRLEIKYAMLLATLDGLVPSVTIVVKSTFLLSGIDLRINTVTCSMIGAMNYILIFLSLLLVMLIAVERSCSVFSERVPAWMWFTMWIYVAFYIGLIGYAAGNGYFVLTPAKTNCTPIAHHSPLSALVLALFGASLCMFLLVTIGCYLRILRFVLHAKRENQSHTSLPDVNTNSVTTRTIVICTIYFLLIFPPAILLILLGTGILQESLVVSLAISLMLFSISFANPALVIFAHSIIFEQFTYILT
ncbi:hypothetical protein DSO57_1023477 [Entomophthora muscae]|uniref:Uncharacterized protein n=1 Tax=Entomophthora muscae TaxID=34485 RepID=A0ACC2SFD5_9FUNG|nr:hypothetical protein DSO57_1023477 [Entomophthora muscae]